MYFIYSPRKQRTCSYHFEVHCEVLCGSVPVEKRQCHYYVTNVIMYSYGLLCFVRRWDISHTRHVKCIIYSQDCKKVLFPLLFVWHSLLSRDLIIRQKQNKTKSVSYSWTKWLHLGRSTSEQVFSCRLYSSQDSSSRCAREGCAGVLWCEANMYLQAPVLFVFSFSLLEDWRCHWANLWCGWDFIHQRWPSSIGYQAGILHRFLVLQK